MLNAISCIITLVTILILTNIIGTCESDFGFAPKTVKIVKEFWYRDRWNSGDGYRFRRHTITPVINYRKIRHRCKPVHTHISPRHLNTYLSKLRFTKATISTQSQGNSFQRTNAMSKILSMTTPSHSHND